LVINPDAVYALNAACTLDNHGRVDLLLDNAQQIYEWLVYDCDAQLVNSHEEA